MRNKRIFRFLLIAICLALSNSCADKMLTDSQIGGDTSADKVAASREYFESTSPGLCQIKLGSSSCDHDHSQTRNGSSPSWQSSNLVPDWEKAYTWDAYKRFYVEVPLKGDGIYRSSILISGRHHRAYPVRSSLVLVTDKATGDINYHVVTTIVETQGRSKPSEEDFHYIGNSDFKGFLLFSKVDGTCIKSLHVRNHKSHPIRIGGSPVVSTRTSSTDTCTAERGYTLSLTSSNVKYSYYESGTGGGAGGFENPVYCALCGILYDAAAGYCPSGCDSGREEFCIICRSYYDASIYNSCPNGCSPYACLVCGKDPCICDQFCERCGSPYCPGPWACSENEDGCKGEKCNVCGGYKQDTRSSSDCPVCKCDEVTEPDSIPIVSKAKKLFRNPNMSEEEWKKLEKILDRLTQDCMGQNLYNGLIQKLNGQALFIQFNSTTTSSFGTLSGNDLGITLGICLENGELLHEMFHALRYKNEDSEATYEKSKLNGEIEAHYAQYLYYSKQPGYKESNQATVDNTDPRWKNIKMLDNYIDNHGILRPDADGTLLSNHILGNVIPAFEASGYTSDKYPYDYDRSENNIFKCISNVTKGC